MPAEARSTALTAARNAAAAARNTWRSSGPHGDAYALMAAKGGWGTVSIDSAIAAGIIDRNGNSLLDPEIAIAEIRVDGGIPCVRVSPR